jgi:hypothetical protein
MVSLLLFEACKGMDMKLVYELIKQGNAKYAFTGKALNSGAGCYTSLFALVPI